MFHMQKNNKYEKKQFIQNLKNENLYIHIRIKISEAMGQYEAEKKLENFEINNS